MPARTTRQQARQRLIDSFMASLDKVIPPDEAVPLRGRTFLDWEKQGEQMKRSLIPTLLEERAALEDNALVERRQAGHCPHCGSDRGYVERQENRTEVPAPDRPGGVARQQCRRRCLDGAFF